MTKFKILDTVYFINYINGNNSPYVTAILIEISEGKITYIDMLGYTCAIQVKNITSFYYDNEKTNINIVPCDTENGYSSKTIHWNDLYTSKEEIIHEINRHLVNHTDRIVSMYNKSVNLNKIKDFISKKELGKWTDHSEKET